MKRISLKRLRKELRVHETELAEKSAKEFKIFVRTLPFRARAVLAYKILRGIL